MRFFSAVFPILFLVSVCAWAQTTVYLTPAEALKVLFADSKEVVSEKKRLSAAQKKILEKEIGSKIAKDDWTFFVARSGRKIDGYAVIDHEIGKSEPITFITAISPKGVIGAVEVLVYRESHGAEVREKAFVRQFSGKDASDPLRVGQDIRNISGATLSARALALGAKRAVALWEVFYGDR
jgi:Na+-translocating ferredoxin:NAD+ oxidoreductase RnfG subunit